MSRRFSLFALLVLILALAIQAANCAAFPLTIKDARGKAIVIKSAPRRIVSLTPHNTEILFALGLGDRVVGVTAWCNYPPAAKKKPKIGDRIVNVERVLSLKPDLILAHANLNDNYIKQLETLRKTIIALDPKTYEQTMSDIALVGRATGSSEQAAAIVHGMRSAVKKVRGAKAAGPRPNVLVVVQPNPLWAAGPKTLADEMLHYCGAKNVAYDSKSGFNQYPVELAVSRQPDVIIVGTTGGQKEFFLTSPIWRSAKAVKQKRVYEMDFDLLVRPGPRLADGLLKLSRIVRGSHHRCNPGTNH
ncbi:MAG: ABC transporter substrate-binding protein [Armatimonadota bacterium]|nr:ABC transporter substrate-binding protein [Armatimonadota bacterium]